MIERKSLKTFFSLFLAGLGIRCLYYLLFSNDLIVGNDTYEYIKLSQRFSSGDLYGSVSPYWSPLYPFLLGIVSLFTKSQILPALIISIIFGSLAAPVTFYLVKQSYENRVALIAAFIILVYPHLLNAVFEMGTENVYLILIISSIIVGWKALTLNSAKSFFTTGVLLGLAYLTRPEAFCYLFFFSFLILYKNWRNKELVTKNSAIHFAVLLLGFALFAAPYIFYLRETTGTWTISSKTNNNLLAGNYSKFSLQPPLNETSSTPASGIQSLKVLAKAVFFNLHNFHKEFPYLVPPFLLMLIALGLFRQKWEKERFQRESYLLFFCFLTILGYCLAVIEVRYFYVLLPIFAGWMARGLVEISNWLRASGQYFLSEKYLFFIRKPIIIILSFILLNLYLLPLNNFMRPREGAWQFSRYEQRDAGLWLKDNGSSAPVVMSRDFRPAFYARGKYIPLTSFDLNEILNEAKENNVDYLVFDERNMKDSPELGGLVTGTENVPELQCIYRANPQAGFQIAIYQLNR